MREGMRGMTLVELLMVLAIVAFLVLQMAGPDWQARRERLQVDGVMRELLGAVDLARAHAITGNVMVTLCRSNDGERCQGQWRDGSIVFTDRNADRVLNDDDRILYRMQPIAAPGSLTFRSFQNRQYLQMTPRGFTNYQNGNFTYCAADGNAALTRQIIVSLSGRSRFARDTDGDGVVEGSQGKAVSCG
jgi:type IV fimbrial biogenesis protein FimT